MSLKSLLETNSLIYEDSFYKDIETFVQLLKKWGRVHNLSGNLDDQTIYENILDSLYPLSFIEDFKSFADIGTGAGYPGLIIAIAKKDKEAYLIEPRAKRVAFLNIIKATLGLKNLTILQKRVEELEDLKVDLITSRAVTNTNLLLNLTQNIKKESSSYLFYKGSMLENELKEAKIKNYKVVCKDDRNYLYIKE
ncbi:16S rRNA (guanine(527)-N(7))-methyltransferase RsmG [Aliarcobacter skirrowii]|uniref:Ribosomal RNA small subunit methyltransferase G n=1 Tax=Aliarcobacter skirrowii TaxID=28200 RepID=A0A2U2C0Q3_9BACT|nr:16S rRNA (guanine(527)-N(7))-methyltransferase RsmG [Aliarcobacter skirrowii]MCT7446736.1 16S rRNA (guanine(527)-N(7))-methyltransferase RsmG [Aliarcobacter skirrowii]MDX4036823.1 16S rRNA (guanine(527)-N(7))-methyltransferase RsmG [Aliarcobacter skirrowii]MDX4071346.1 16S rRNA (guanine(527)-N(7))-methyltransferase RsmG [Aliarcobacter skirrowii]PWE21594.1 16S rRNA (guanine(527)-N(7))-methyltransferase RsmG [Aliarcobacter skirrowii]PWE21958.1 16S rRNA (guanine(527)-N(7))-methyltransferase Rs